MWLATPVFTCYSVPKWLPWKRLTDFKVSLFINKKIIINIQNKLSDLSDHQACVSWMHLELRQNQVKVHHGAVLWNKPPADLRSAATLSPFKSNRKNVALLSDSVWVCVVRLWAGAGPELLPNTVFYVCLCVKCVLERLVYLFGGF